MEYAKIENGEKIYIDDANRQTNYYCVICDSPVVVKKGEKNAHHFSHLQHTGEDCSLKYSQLYENQSIPDEDVEVVHNEVDYNVKFEKKFLNINIDDLSPQQKEAWEKIIKWIQDENDLQFVLSGFAGTGKSYLVHKIKECLILNKQRYNIMSFTGKAVDVLRNQGIPEAETIHSTIYKPILDNKNKIVGWRLDGSNLNKFVIIDEYSFVDEKILKDLRSFKKKILYTGDFFQLPPINGENEIQKSTNYFLTDIVRQAKDNPIIKYATIVREGGRLETGIYESKDDMLFATISRNHPKIDELLLRYDQVLCGTNKFRHMLNSTIRNGLGYSGMLPNPGEKLICLKNNRELNMFNGQMFENKFINFKDEFEINGHRITDIDLGVNEESYISKEIFYEKSSKLKDLWSIYREDYSIIKRTLFADSGYAISVHKAQGSQFESVVVFAYDGYWMRENFNKWLYTSITRGIKKCVVVL